MTQKAPVPTEIVIVTWS